jgi:hypothetical protein
MRDLCLIARELCMMQTIYVLIDVLPTWPEEKSSNLVTTKDNSGDFSVLTVLRLF